MSKTNKNQSKNQQNEDALEKSERIEQVEKIIISQMEKLKNQYWNYIRECKRNPYVLSQNSSYWYMYLKCHYYSLEKYDKYDFTGVQINAAKAESIIGSEGDIFTNFQIIPTDMKAYFEWDLRISNKLNDKLINMDPQQLSLIMRQILGLQCGFMSDSTLLETGPIMFLAGFTKAISKDKNLVFAVVPERVPQISVKDKIQSLVGFKYHQYLRCIDIVQNQKQAFQVFEAFKNNILSDPDKGRPFFVNNFISNKSLSSNVNQNKQILDLSNIVNISRYSKTYITYKPSLKQTVTLTPKDAKAFTYTYGRWISEMESSSLSYLSSNTMRNKNSEIIEKCTSESSCIWLLNTLQKLPNFTLKLTQEEELLITTPGNVLCIGRSGTGKTTSAVLRLFALELLFKVRYSLLFKKDSGDSLQDSRKFTLEDAESSTGLHSVIVTASPVLTNEIRRFYQSFQDKIMQELKKRDQKKKQKSEENKLENQEIKQEEEQVEEKKEESESKAEEMNIEQEDDELQDAEEIEKNLKMPYSMLDMTNENFPAFLTVKRLIYMIDGSLNKPFFVRNDKNQIIGQDQQSAWHNEAKGILMINNYFKQQQMISNKKNNEIDTFLESSSESSEEEEDEAQEDIQEQEVKHQNKKRKIVKKRNRGRENVVQEFAQEIDYEVFQQKFWPKFGFKEQTNLSCSSLWTEIFSVIKGSHNSYEFPEKVLPLETYLQRSNYSAYTEEQVVRERTKVYNLFSAYETWKRSIKGFDFMDLVNHILREIGGIRYFGVPIHFMLVDEVQDLTPSTIKLLLQVTEQNVYFAGDTAQTIARGVGFRFCDLQKMVNMSDFQAPKVLQLTINFRSHNQILNLANSIISAIEIFFPQTIDKLLKEKSNVNGLKPIVLDSSLLESLFYILMGNQNNEKKEKAEFGCDQVIIVRDQEAKKRIPHELQHALCLTVYECKGLEFEDVILFNFFSDSKIGENQWAVLHDIKVKKELQKVDKQKQNKPRIQTITELNIQQEEENKQEAESEDKTKLIEEEIKRGENYEYSDKFYVTNKRQNMLQNYNALCTELKQLYVCVTRPKKRLIIYDEETSNRQQIFKYWEQLQAVDLITEEMIQNSLQNMDQLSEEEKLIMTKIAESQPHLLANDQVREEVREKRKKGWKLQGITMFKRRFYEQAIKCFTHAGEDALKQRAEAYNLAEKGQQCLSEKDQILNKLSDFSHQYSKQESRAMKQQQKQLSADSLKHFLDAAALFSELGFKKQAAQCCFTAEDYEQSGRIFEEIGYYAQAGESYYLLGNYKKAAQLYSEGKAVTQAVECYKKLKNWEAILSCVKENEQLFSHEQREKLVFKYVPLALNDLYNIVISDSFKEGSDQEEEEEELLIMGRAHSIKEDVKEEDANAIAEANEEDEEEEDEQTLEEKKEDEKEISKINITDASIKDEVNDSSENIVNIDTSTKQFKKSSQNQSQSFEVVSENSLSNNSKILEPMNNLESFEHLSQFDLEDEFIKSRPASVIESILSGSYNSQNLNFENQKSELSCYSIIQSQTSKKENEEELTAQDKIRNLIQMNINLIQTKRDIYAEDILMSKIVYYVSQFSQDVQYYLSKMRSKEALLSQNKTNNNQTIQIDTDTNKVSKYEFIDELDYENFDAEFINIILDGLESFELYKLCIIVCNRYKLKDRIGRYLVSIGHKYSNLTEVKQKSLALFHKAQKDIQQQVSFMAHHAMHSSLELIEPEYLKLKEQQNDLSLGQYTYTALINLGYWKKLIYLMNVKSGLCISSSFADFQSFRQIYLGYVVAQDNQEFHKEDIIKKINSNSFDFLKPFKNQIPSNKIEFLAFKTALESIVWTYNDNPTLIFDVKFPEFLHLTEQALKIQKKQSSCQLIFDQIEKVINNISKKENEDTDSYKSQLEVSDACQAIMILLYNAFKEQKQQQQINQLVDLEPEQFSQFVGILQKVFVIFKTQNSFSHQNLIYSQSIVFGLLSVLKIKQLIPCEDIYDNFGDKVLLNYASPIAKDIIKNIEDRKRKLTEKATKTVFEHRDAQFYTKSELNKKIREELREALQEENIDYQLEIIDLDANFFRVPLKLVLNYVLEKIVEYVKRSGNRLMNKQPLSDLHSSSKEDIQHVLKPFEIEHNISQSLSQLSLCVQISNFSAILNPKEITWKTYLFKRLQDQIMGIEDDKEKHKNKKLISQQLTKGEIYLLEKGLITEEQILKEKQYQSELKEKRLQLQTKLKNSSQMITFMSALTFNFQGTKFNNLERNILLELAQEYWKLFMLNLSYNKGQSKLNDAVNSLGLFLMADSYLLFMEVVQTSLGYYPKVKAVLLSLLDFYIYKKCGDLLESSKSLISFFKQNQELEFKLEQNLTINLLQQVIADQLIISPAQIDHLYIPYEILRQFLPFLKNVEENQQNEFYDQVEAFEEQQVVLKLENNQYMKCTDKKKFQEVTESLIQILCKQISSLFNVDILQSLFISLATLIVNVPEYIQKQQAKVFEALRALSHDTILSEEHSIYQYESLEDYSYEFKELEFQDQNEVLDMIDCKNTFFVQVELKQDKNQKELAENTQLNLKKAEDDEGFIIQVHQFLNLKVQNMRKNASYKMKINKTKVYPNYEQVIMINSLQDEHQLSQIKIIRSLQKQQQQIINIIQQSSRLNKYIINAIQSSTFDKVIDYHYLLTQREKNELEILPQLVNIFQSTLVKVSSFESLEKTFTEDDLRELERKINDIKTQIDVWSYTKYEPNQQLISRNKKIMKLKWKEHAQKIKERLLAKAQGQKRNEKKQLKKEKLKQRGFS